MVLLVFRLIGVIIGGVETDLFADLGLKILRLIEYWMVLVVLTAIRAVITLRALAEFGALKSLSPAGAVFFLAATFPAVAPLANSLLLLLFFLILGVEGEWVFFEDMEDSLISEIEVLFVVGAFRALAVYPAEFSDGEAVAVKFEALCFSAVADLGFFDSILCVGDDIFFLDLGILGVFIRDGGRVR